MALKSKTKRLRVASMRPTEMSAGGGGGLEDRFHATVEEVRTVAWAYPKKDGSEGVRALFSRVKYRPDEDDQPDDAKIREDELEKNDGLIVQHYSMGAKLNHWLPSEDGQEPVDIDDEDHEGVYAIPTDELIELLENKGIDLDDEANWPQLNKGSNWAFWVQKLVDCGFPEESIEADIRCFEGAHVRLDRVPRPAFSGQSNSATGEQKSSGDGKVLVPTELLDKPKKGKAAGKVAGKAASKMSLKGNVVEEEEEEEETPKKKSPAGKKASAKTNGSDLNATVEAAIVAALKKAPLVEVEDEDGDTVEVRQMQRTKLHQFAIKAVGSSDKKAALELMNDEEFYEGSEVLQFDPDEGTVTLIEA